MADMNCKKDLELLTLRELAAGDELLLNEFFDQMGGESRALFNRRDYNRKGVLKQCSRPDPARRYWLALLEGRMAGYVFFLDWSTGVPELGLAVRDELQGRHLGRRLVEFALQEAKNAGKGGVVLTTHLANLRAQALYESCGFRQMGVGKNGTEVLYLYRFS